MVAVAASPAERSGLLDAVERRLSVAAVNGPSATVVSGDPAGAGRAAGGAAGPRVSGPGRSRSDYASHSPQVEALRDELLDALAGIAPRPGDDPDVLHGDRGVLDGTGAGAGYWYAQPAPAGAVRRAVDVLAAAGLPGVRRGVPASGADRRGHRDAGRGRERRWTPW